jgi:hypothetical protein
MNNVVNVKFGKTVPKPNYRDSWDPDYVEEYMDHLPYRKSKPLELNVHIACALGIKEAFMVQKICELECVCGDVFPHLNDPYMWVKLSYTDVETELGNLWGRTAIKNALRKLRNMGILVVHKFGVDQGDLTNWYRLDYDRLEEICYNN